VTLSHEMLQSIHSIMTFLATIELGTQHSNPRCHQN